MSDHSVPPAGEGLSLPVRDQPFLSRFRAAPPHGRACTGLLAACWTGFAACCPGQEVFWGTESFASHQDSRGSKWEQRFVIELGVFENGFSPTVENREQWAAHWTPLSHADFDAEDARYSGHINPAETPLTVVGRQAFVWARDGEQPETGPEWLMISHPSWKIPGPPRSAPGPAVVWITSSASQFIVGTQSPDGCSLVSEMVRPVPVPISEWLATHLDDTTDDTCPTADPDGDGLCNLLEYALGTDPSCAVSHRGPELHHVGGRVTISLARNPRSEAAIRLESSTDLTHWRPVAGEWILDRPNLLEADIPRDPAKTSAYFRVAVKPKEVVP